MGSWHSTAELRPRLVFFTFYELGSKLTRKTLYTYFLILIRGFCRDTALPCPRWFCRVLGWIAVSYLDLDRAIDCFGVGTGHCRVLRGFAVSYVALPLDEAQRIAVNAKGRNWLNDRN